MNLSSEFKKVIIVVFVFALGMPALQAQDKNNLYLGEQELFKASKNTFTLTIDGKMDEASWKNTEVRTFDFFYSVEKASDQQNTAFRMMWDDENLYVFFDCKDQYITARETQRDGVPYLDDCAEIFLIPAPDSLNIHFGFEINLNKAANDFIFVNDFNKGERASIKAYNPAYKTAVSIQGTVNDNSDIDTGWTMEMAIPLSAFNGVGYSPIAEGVQWAFLAVRQNRDDVEGDRRSTSTIFSIYDIDNNVHQPNRFGLVEFVK